MVMVPPSIFWPLTGSLGCPDHMLNTLPWSTALEEEGCSDEQACSVGRDLINTAASWLQLK